MRCISNDFREIGLYNNYLLTVDSKDETHIYLKDKTTTYKIPLKKYTQINFKYGYAITSYGVQGKTLQSYHVPAESIKYFASDPRSAYVIVSRLKQNIIKSDKPKKQKPVTRVKKNGDVFDNLLNMTF